MKGAEKLVILAALTGFVLVEGSAVAEAEGSSPLAVYAGKYPYDKVQGLSFRAHPKVMAALKAAVPDTKIRRQVLAAKDAVDSPILVLSHGRLFSRSFKAASGGEVNWAILITDDGAKAAVCYSTDAVYGSGGASWYTEGKKVFDLKGSCPSEKDEIEKNFGGGWPAYPLPEN